ncbi:lantibiotic dehydratase [Clostridium botulinum]|uniref:lantibiotic dehydratase n=1 Tax=Clostridium botulinum TaxID=1491 RepID=UPI003DA6084F
MNDNENNFILDKIYKPLDFFMVRTPILPVNSYNYIFDNELNNSEIIEKLIHISKDPIIRETIAVASPDLLSSLDKLNTSINEKEKEKILSSLLKYFIRMSTRTTPFGIFSGVTSGKFTNETNINLKDISEYRKRARPDMEWVFKVINYLEKKDHILKDLVVTWNSIAEFIGSRVELVYTSIYAQERNDNINSSDKISIRASVAVKYVAKKSLNGIKYNDLLNLLIEKYPDTDAIKIDNFLKELINKEILITELRPPLDIPEPYRYVLGKLEHIELAKEDFDSLSEIEKMIKYYNSLPIGNGENQYLNIISKMKNITKSKSYLQVDLRILEDKIELNKCIANELAEFAGMLFRLSSVENNVENIEQYKTDFIERYGEEQEVPLLEVINPDKGLGFPADYTVPFSNKQLHQREVNKNFLNIQEHFVYKVIKAINNKESIIEFNHDDIKEIQIEKSSFNNIPRSLELNVFIRADSKEDIDNGNYELFLGPNAGSDSAGKTFGRFGDILDKQIYDEFKKINNIEKQQLDSGKIFTQLIFAPTKGSIGNICLSPNIRDYEIILSTSSSIEREKVISIEDLVVGINRNRLYLKSISLNKEVIVTTNHMLNRRIMPNICRFLLDISEDKRINWFPMRLLETVSKFPYVPQIKVDKVILNPKTWILNEDILNTKLKNISKKEFEDVIKKWKSEWNVPNFIYQVEADNRLMFNLNNKVHLNELLNILKKKKNIKITDVECSFNNFWINNSRGKYVSEFVVPIIKENIYTSYKESNSISFSKKNSNITTLDSKRTIFPGDEWLFLKLYGNHSREEELIAFEINDICRELMETKCIEQFFFMRYADPDNHIRLRVKSTTEDLFSKALPKLNKWFKSLKNNGLLSRVGIDTYKREIERYGGMDLIDCVEKVFFYDSIAVSNILYLFRLNRINMDLSEIALCSIISYLEDFNIPYLDQVKLLDAVIKQSENRKEFQKKRTRYMHIANSNNNWENLRSSQDGEQLYNILKSRTEAIQEYAIKLNKKNDLTNTLENIYLSVIHLHCNRLFGTDRQKEREVLSFVRHTLYALKYFKVE